MMPVTWYHWPACCWGNCLTANILTLERFYQSIDSQYDRYMNDLLLGRQPVGSLSTIHS